MAESRPVLKIGQLVNIELADSKGPSIRYPCRVEDVDKDTVTLTSPLKGRIPVLLPVGSSVGVWYRDSLAAYTFSAYVVSNKKGRLPLVVITKPENVKRVQMRAHVRVAASISVLIEYKDIAGNKVKMQCISKDISAGGMMLIFNKPTGLGKNDVISLRFELNGEKYELPAKVIRNDWILDSDGIERTVLAVQFTEIDNDSATKIIKYVYQRQIELRKKGLL